ncbi:MAG: DUF6607 family protein [Sphingomonas sp.]
MRPILVLALILAFSPPAGALAQPGAAPIDRQEGFEADRRAILAMAGNYRVRFDMRETTSWRSDYTPIDPSTSGGNEIVRVIADTGRFISLQHILVMGTAEQPVVIKHWRQDWTYEPETVLAYTGPNQWTLQRVSAAERRGAWSQTVWQVDDSPRYGGVGRWTTTGGVRRWQSGWTWRPLARRDAIRTPRYDRYLSINRHSPTPDGGWIHWQDNQKMGMVDGALVPFVQESLLNTYRPSTDYQPGPGDRYWATTQDYWAAVRGAWDRVAREQGGIRIEEEAQTGNVIASRLFEMGNEINAGTLQTAAAITEAQRLISEATARR